MNEDFLKKFDRRKKRKSEPREKEDIEDPFVKHAKKKGCLAIKLVFLSGRGWPDRTVLLPGGRIFFIEFKRKGKKPSPKQEQWKNILEKLGFTYYVCDEPGQAEDLLDHHL